MRPTIQWNGPTRDSSGYGEASRNYIASILTADPSMRHNLRVHPIQYEPSEMGFGYAGALAESVTGDKLPAPDINVIHCMATAMHEYINPDAKVNIGFTVWETDKLPTEWVDALNKLDEVWTSLPSMRHIFQKSGVSVPVYCVPHALDLLNYSPGMPPVRIEGLDENRLTFYSIGVWSERKCSAMLVKAFCEEFSYEDPVQLFLKTYHHTRRPIHREPLFDEIRQLAGPQESRPPVVVSYGWDLTDQVMAGIHSACDVYLSPHRGECPGLPQLQALACGNQVISTNFLGISDWSDIPGVSWLDHKKVPVEGMSWWRFYEKDQNWAQPDITQLRQALRAVFETTHRGHYNRWGREYVADNFSWSTVGDLVMSRAYDALSRKA